MSNIEFSLAQYDETIRTVLDSGGEFRIYPKGTSMLPLIRAGLDSVSLAKPSDSLRRGDIVFYLRDSGEYVLHRIIKAENGFYTLCGDNQLAPESGIENRHIIGVVAKIYRGDKLLPVNSLCCRIYSAMWQSFFVRRVYFRLRRIFGKGRTE